MLSIGLVGWPIADTLPTQRPHVNHRSGEDQGKSRSNQWATPQPRTSDTCAHEDVWATVVCHENCTSDCTVRGAGLCDTTCSTGSSLQSDYTCECKRRSVRFQSRISSVAIVTYATGLALLGASRHPMKNCLRHSGVFSRSVGKRTFCKAYLASALCISLLCHLCCYGIYKLMLWSFV